MLQHFRRSVDVLNLLVRCSVCVCVCVCDYFLRDLLTHVTSTGLVGELCFEAFDPANKHSWLENEPNLKMYFPTKKYGFCSQLC